MNRSHGRNAIRVTALMLTFLCLLSSWTAMASTTLPPIVGYDSEHPENLSTDQIYASSAILIDQDSGRVLFEKNADQQRSMASTTKVMTLLLAVEFADRNDYYDQIVTVPGEAAQIPSDSTVIPVAVGEKLAFRDLLYGFMLHSGNDGANAIAVIVSGSIADFVDLMNRKAEELGLDNTHFVNAHGYTADGHYTTARDLARLAQEAVKNDTFRRIVSTGSYIMEATNKRGGITVTNTNKFATGTSGYRYKYGTGIKTGYTNAAGHCLVGSATDDRGVNLISVVLNSTSTNSEAKWIDTTRLMNYGFAQYKEYTFNDLYSLAPVMVGVSNYDDEDPYGGELKLNAIINRSTSYRAMYCEEELDEAVADLGNYITYEITHSLEAPIEQDMTIGTLTFSPPGSNEIVTAILTAQRSVAAAPPPISWNTLAGFFEVVPFWMIAVVVVLAVVLIALSAAQASARKRRRANRNRTKNY